MKRILLSLAFLAACVAARAQYTDYTGNQTYTGNCQLFERINAAGNSNIFEFVNLPATGQQALWLSDGTLGATVPAILGSGFTYSYNSLTGYGAINPVNSDWNATSGNPGYIANKPSTPNTESATVTTDSSGNVTWTFPTAYPAGTVPRCSCLPHGTTTTNINAQWISATNTSVTFKVWSLPSTSVLGIVVLGAPTGASSLVCDVIATA